MIMIAGITYPLGGWSDGPEHMITGVVYDSTDQLLFVAVRRPWSVDNQDNAGTLIATYRIV
jgi:hypothetical protein